MTVRNKTIIGLKLKELVNTVESMELEIRL